MNTKLTLRLDHELIAQAKVYAQAHGRSVSELVATCFSRLSVPDSGVGAQPLRRSEFYGIAKAAQAEAALDEARLASLQRMHA